MNAIPVEVWDGKAHITGIPAAGILDSEGRVIRDGREVATPDSAMIVCAAASKTLMSNGVVPGLRDALASHCRVLEEIHKAAKGDTDPEETAKRVKQAQEVLTVDVALPFLSANNKKEHIENPARPRDLPHSPRRAGPGRRDRAEEPGGAGRVGHTVLISRPDHIAIDMSSLRSSSAARRTLRIASLNP